MELGDDCIKLLKDISRKDTKKNSQDRKGTLPQTTENYADIVGNTFLQDSLRRSLANRIVQDLHD